jgi:hypothetical protein
MQPSRILPDLQCSLVCEDVRREANGKFIIIGALNFLVVPQVPFGVRVLVFNQWTTGVGQFRENVRIIAPDQTTVISKGEVKFALQDAAHHAANLNVFGLKLEKTGVYFVEVLVDDVMKLRYPLPVLIAQQQAGAPAENLPSPQ